MSDKPWLTIDWTGATEADKAKALAAITVRYVAAGVDFLTAAQASGAREAEVESADKDFAYSDSVNHDYADLWDGMQYVAAEALGVDANRGLPNLKVRLEPYVSIALGEAPPLRPSEMPY